MRTFALVLSLSLGPIYAQQVGQPLPAWTPGTLDIHQINTGRGNAGLIVFPDGTSMLLDAGDGGNPPPRGTAPKPDASRTPAEWIARYVRHMLAFDAQPAVDYAYVTHFHDDHMAAFAAVSKLVPFRAVIDRGWPSYDYPAALSGEMISTYRAALTGLKVERLQPGRNDQIVLRRDARKYPNFEVRNIAANGEIWTGVANNTRQYFPRIQDLQAADYPTENMCSLAIRISYGKFDYFSGGDMPGVRRDGMPIWNDVETPVAQVVGPVEASILNHHGNRDSQNFFFLSALRPRVFVISVWSADHPGHDVLDRMYSARTYAGERDVFATNMMDANKAVIGALLARLKSTQGHIVIRVAPGGDTFQVIILDDSAETYRVTSVHGPYASR
jgi:beta-lactamase superfamily II metal-dependent hydrolase